MLKRLRSGSSMLPACGVLAKAVCAITLLGSGALGRPESGFARADAADLNGRERISESDCRSAEFDHANLFPPEGEQGAQGQCYAFTAAGLLDEQACIEGLFPCGKQRFSPIDVARDYPDKMNRETGAVKLHEQAWERDFFTLGNANQGGLEFELLEAGLEFGVCEERHAPWFPELTDSCRSSSDRSQCVLQGLKKQWRAYARAKKDLECNPATGVPETPSGEPMDERTRTRLTEILDQTRKLLPPEAESGTRLELELGLTQSEFEFIENVLIPPSCRENRLRPKGRSWKENWTEEHVFTRREQTRNADGSVTMAAGAGTQTHESLYSNQERFSRLAGRVREHGRSVALGLCSQSATTPSRSRKDDPRLGPHCAPHALIANGIRWNADEGRCEIHLRNSWGPQARLRGWLAVEPVLNSTFRISGIAPR